MDLIGFAAETHQGPFLNLNEDSFDYDLEHELYMIFDGFGGHGRGDYCVKHLQENIRKFYGNFVVDRNSTLPFFYSPRYLPEGNALVNAVLNSHQKLYEENQPKNLGERAGASGIIMAKVESLMTFLNVGNCRAYLLRDGEMKTIFTDDSFGYLCKNKDDGHFKNIPLSGFGLFPDLHYQVREVRAVSGDKIIILSDGVYNRLTKAEIRSCIEKNSINIKGKIRELFSQSNEKGNKDNQTCMVLEF